jgi:hypothetical protein
LDRRLPPDRTPIEDVILMATEQAWALERLPFMG